MKTPLIHSGDRIAGKYRILRMLGRGGMGEVYLAQHERLNRLVAIKVLLTRLDQRDAAIIRFEREIKAMALVNNPHVTHALDADVLDDGSLYLVMEYLDGRDLRAELRLRRAIPFPEAVAYVIQACEGVAAVHDVGIIHRDLKPRNLFLTQLRAARCVKVLDFGIAKFLVGADVTVTATDVSVGTPLYMSPEQLCDPRDVSPRSDVWALGAVLYELIAGVSPFAADSPAAVVVAVMLEDPVLLSQVVPEVPEPLARIIAETLVKSPAMRIGSARELADQLAPFGMATDAIFVPSPVPSQRPVVALVRASMRPEFSALIRSEVEAFDEDATPGEDDTRLDALRELPSLAKLSIPLANPTSPATRHAQPSHPERRTAEASAGIITTVPSPQMPSPSLVSQPNPSVRPRSSTSVSLAQTHRPLRRSLQVFGTLMLILGVLAFALALKWHALDRSQPVLLPPPSQTAAPLPPNTAFPQHSPVSTVPSTTLTDPPTGQELANRSEVPAPSATVRSSLSKTARPRRPSTAPSPHPPLSAPISTAADGRPLHL